MQNKRRTNYRRQQTKQSKDDHAIPIKVLLCKNYVFSVKKSNIWYYKHVEQVYNLLWILVDSFRPSHV